MSFSPQAQASPSTIFSKFYAQNYRAGQCGANVLSFLQEIQDEEGNLDGWKIAFVKNRGLSVFGMVNAEQARDESFGRPAVREKNWYHHAFAIDGQGYVYDFDYLTSPKRMKFKPYIEHMFLDEEECLSGGSGLFCAGRNVKLNDYQIELMDAEQALSRRGEPEWKGSLKDALKKIP
jgi:hypothetical protein